MNLENKLQQQKKRVVRRHPSAEALAQVEMGNKFIIVQDDFDLSNVPQGYTLIDMRHKGISFKTLIPQSLLFYMANPGEGNPNQALEEIADFYGEAKDFEDDLIENGKTNVQETNWATLAKGSYDTYLINRLVKHRKGEKDGKGEPVPELNTEVLRQLNLNDSYVSQRVKAIAAIALGKTADQIDTHEVKDVLRHVSVGTKKTKVKERLTREEFEKITCWAGSHYEIKSEYRKGDVKYEIEYEHSKSHMEGKKTFYRDEDIIKPVLDAKIRVLEEDIAEYRKKIHSGLGRHDQALIRQYINLTHIAPENPRAQLNIKPPEKARSEEK